MSKLAINLTMILCFIVSFNIFCQTEGYKDEFMWGKLENGVRVGNWQYFDNPGDLSLVINHSSGKIVYLKKDSASYLIKKGEQWIETILVSPPRFIGSKEEVIQCIKKELNFNRGTEGYLRISFEIDTLGRAKNYVLEKSLDKSIDSKALEAVTKIPNTWIQGISNSGSVSSKIIVNITCGIGKEFEHNNKVDQSYSDLPYAINVNNIVIATDEIEPSIANKFKYSPASGTLLLNKNNKICDHMEAETIRVFVPSRQHSDLYFVRDYYLSGRIKRIAYSGDINLLTKHSKYEFFYENGIKSNEGEYFNGLKTGEWNYWYSSGQLKKVINYQIDKQSKSSTATLIQYWDEKGTQLVFQGKGYINRKYEQGIGGYSQGAYENGVKSGEWKGYDKQGSHIYTEKYEEGKLVIGKSWDHEGLTFEYKKLKEQPEYPGGMAKFYKLVGKNMNYPRDARKEGIEGRVYVEFFVNKKGNVVDAAILQGISEGANREALRVIGTSGQWIPGKTRGQIDRVKMILPITFKLS